MGLGMRDEEMRPAKIAQLAERFGSHSVWFSGHILVTRKPGSDSNALCLSEAKPVPNPYEAPRCQETNVP
jgi:alkanesulfonate monooxygenase SsuD/methylene tetrahydromethanopterin reductase-like flavin-dependent oxidoreductase (luciferase family)